MDNYFMQMWNEAELWRLITAFVFGVVVGFIYFYSLRWSINHLNETKHRFGMFGLLALCRIVLFFAVLIMISKRNVVIILIYLLAFFLTKIVIVGIEKGNLIVDKSDNDRK